MQNDGITRLTEYARALDARGKYITAEKVDKFIARARLAANYGDMFDEAGEGAMRGHFPGIPGAPPMGAGADGVQGEMNQLMRVGPQNTSLVPGVAPHPGAGTPPPVAGPAPSVAPHPNDPFGSDTIDAQFRDAPSADPNKMLPGGNQKLLNAPAPAQIPGAVPQRLLSAPAGAVGAAGVAGAAGAAGGGIGKGLLGGAALLGAGALGYGLGHNTGGTSSTAAPMSAPGAPVTPQNGNRTHDFGATTDPRDPMHWVSIGDYLLNKTKDYQGSWQRLNAEMVRMKKPPQFVAEVKTLFDDYFSHQNATQGMAEPPTNQGQSPFNTPLVGGV
jgi:hypothetical protein